MKTDKKLETRNWYYQIPLTIKIVMVTVIIGVFLWFLLDYVQSSKLKKIFYIQLLEKLTEQSMQSRLHVDRYIRAHDELSELFIDQKNFIDYVNKQRWSKDDPIPINYYHDLPPSWFPRPSILRMTVRPRYAILLDPTGRAREVYSRRRDSSPPAMLLRPTRIMLSKSREQSYITKIDDTPYLMKSESLLNTEGQLKATLILACPVDEGFLNASMGVLTPGYFVALVTPEKDPRIIVSSNHQELPRHTPLRTLQDRFLITGHQTYEYGAAEYMIKLVSFISMAEVDKLTEAVITTGREQRNIIAPIFILTFAVIMFLVTRRINRLNSRMSEFSQETLGKRKHELRKGDQLYLLEKRFQLLTEEVIEAREIMKKEAEEKTRLIVNNASDAIITFDTEGRIMMWNPQAETVFGLTHEEAAGRKVADTIIPFRYREAYEKGLKDFLATGESPILNKQIQITALHSDGHEFPVEVSVSQARSEGNYFFITIMRDITARKNDEEQIKASLIEKEVLLGEIHHRVKNNMQVISSLLSLQSEYVRDKQYISILNESKNRIKSMALVHEKLYQSKDMANVDFSDYIKTLANSLFSFYSVNTGNISINIDIKDVVFGVDTAIPCGLIINELLSNSLKHAFPEGRRGEISITLKKIGAEWEPHYELVVSDNGVGIPEGLDIGKTKSLGLQLITTLVSHQLQGKLNLIRNDGTTFHIRFKEIKYAKRI